MKGLFWKYEIVIFIKHESEATFKSFWCDSRRNLNLGFMSAKQSSNTNYSESMQVGPKPGDLRACPAL